ncbi:MAG: EAL domain-containing protein [Magnetococcales bacterium]|nr:EAL domain-containing protein [Magnetococcales bacterium]
MQKDSSNTLVTLVQGFALILLLMAIFSISAIIQSDSLAELTVKMYRHPLTVSNAVLEVDADIIAMHRHMKDVALARNNSDLEEAIAQVNHYEELVNERFKIIRERYLGEKTTIDAAQTAFIDWRQIRAEVIALRRLEQHEKAAEITKGKGAEHVKLLTKRMEALIIFARKKAEEFLNHSKTKHRNSRFSLYSMMILGIISGSWIAWFTISRIRQAQQKQFISEERIRTIVENANDGIIAINQLGIIELFSPASEKMFDYNAKEVIGKNVELLMPEHIRPHHNGYIKNYLKDGKGLRGGNSLESYGVRKDGSTFPIEISVGDAKLNDQYIITGIVRDITNRRKTENRLLLAKKVIENASEAILVTDANSNITDVNPAYEKISGYSLAEVLGKHPSITKSGRHSKSFYEDMWNQILERGSWSGEIWDRRKSGEVYPKWLSISAIKNSAGEVENYVGLFMDISQQKVAEEKLEKLAFYDPLTQLPNRALFRDRLNLEIQKNRRNGSQSALFFIDLDHFKHVNDTLGHDYGDKLLIKVAQRIGSCLRESDSVCRLGGDEFTVILVGLHRIEDAGNIAKSIIDKLHTAFDLDGSEVFIGGSIGIALCPVNGNDYETLTKNADIAMYRAKESGRGNYKFFTQDMDEKNAIRLALEGDLRKAVNNLEFTVYYQPKIDLKTGKINGMEALVRWIHPIKGIIPPGDFIPLAEETGLIIPLGEWVLQESCIQVKKWWDAGLPQLRVAVNLSPLQFQAPNLVEKVHATLTQTGLDPMGLELEITESMAMDSVESAIEKVACLRDLGVQISIDDFGTGYSSLSHLKKFPLHALKIDQSFVRDLTIDSDDAAIVASILSMAKSMNLKVVAEGVENIEQLNFLKDKDCQEVQGFYFSRPISSQEFEKLLQK